MLLPCPPIYFVIECSTISQPCSTGRQSAGVGTVLSTMTGTPCACAISAIAPISGMLPAGLPMDSREDAGGLVVDVLRQVIGAVAIGKANINAQLGQHMAEERPGAAIELGHGDDVVARLGQIEEWSR